jgi:hypothetical protein
MSVKLNERVALLEHKLKQEKKSRKRVEDSLNKVIEHFSEQLELMGGAIGELQNPEVAEVKEEEEYSAAGFQQSQVEEEVEK